VQKWASVFDKIPLDHYYHYAPQIEAGKEAGLPGINAATLTDKRDFTSVVNAAIEDICKREGKRDLTILYLSDGPYAIPYVK
jgi:hypothetical protein